MKTDEIVTHLRRLSDVMHDEGRPEWCVIAAEAADALEAQAREIAALRRAIESACPAEHGFTEEFPFLVALGLLVEVPADERHREEWDEDMMWVWAWSPLAAGIPRDGDAS